jgi:hypothetical protein
MTRPGFEPGPPRWEAGNLLVSYVNSQNKLGAPTAVPGIRVT